ncbi:MAG: UDP-glucuronic acid decarboxylase family protein [Candidatus Omnitrophota bacterium]
MKNWVLITGGAGFIGSHICDHLLSKGYRVIAIDNLLTGSIKNITHLTGDKDFRFIKHDVTKYIDIKENIDYVLHFASPASPSDYLNFPIQTLKVGSLGTHNALGLAKGKKTKFLLASTSEIYGDPLVNPQPESYWGNVNTIGPRGVYDEAKRFGEAITMAYHHTHKLDTKIVRIFNTFGEKMRIDDGRAIPNFIEQALNNKEITVYGSGKQTRSFCYIQDLIEGIYRLMISNVNTPMNIGNPNEMNVMDLAKRIKKLSGSRSKIVKKSLPIDDPKVRCPDIAFANRKLKWKPRVALEDGLERTIEYFRNAK